MARNKILFTVLVAMGLSIRPLFAQEDILKNIAEDHRESKFALYASTLRMINLQHNEDYNTLVNGVEKMLIYVMDSTSKAEKSFLKIGTDYQAAGFEEYASAYGGETYMALLGKEGTKTNEMVGYLYVSGNKLIAFYLRGNVPWEKIPFMIKSFQNSDFINFLDLKL